MKVTIEFDGEDGERQARMALGASSMYIDIEESLNQIRTRLKHGQDVSHAEAAVLEYLRETLSEAIAGIE